MLNISNNKIYDYKNINKDFRNVQHFELQKLEKTVL